MADEPQPQSKFSYGAYSLYRIAQAVLAIAFALFAYTQATTAYIHTQQAIEALAVGNNAPANYMRKRSFLRNRLKSRLRRHEMPPFARKPKRTSPKPRLTNFPPML